MSNKSSVGIVKEIDRLGRICIPKEIRELFNLENQVELVITADGVLMRNPSFRLVRRTSAVKKQGLICHLPTLENTTKGLSQATKVAR